MMIYRFIIIGTLFLSSCAKDPVILAPDSIFPGKGFEYKTGCRKGEVHRDTLCKKHRIPVKVIDGFRYRGLMTGSPWYEEAVKDSPNIQGPSFSRTQSDDFPNPTREFVCPTCRREYLKVRARYLNKP